MRVDADEGEMCKMVQVLENCTQKLEEAGEEIDCAQLEALQLH
jgi:hypothetical protein